MFKVATIDAIRMIETSADASGVSYADMMQRAGKVVADRALFYTQHLQNPQITVLVGTGNNGGDGLVAGLFIAQSNENARVRFYLLKDRPQDDPYIAVAQEAGLLIATAENDSDKRLLRNMIASSDVVIDALFGIGVRLPLRDEAQRVLRAVNQAINERRAEKPENLVVNPIESSQIPTNPPIIVLAVDTPSGLDADTGELDKNAVNADETITFIAAKRGLFLFEGAQAVGKLMIANIGLSEKLPAIKAQTDCVVDASFVQQTLPLRPLNSHKGTFGKALIVAGSAEYYGAPLMAAEACYRVGTGLVTLATSPALIQAIAPHLPETTWLSLPLENTETFTDVISTLGEHVKKYSALLIGCGLGNTPTTSHFLTTFLQHQSPLPPLVIDADGLNILSDLANWWELLPPNTIITPHPTEMARLSGLTTEAIQQNRWNIAREKAQEWQTIILLKGAHTLIAHPNGEVAVLPFKTDALAKAGTGDVLAGMVVGFLAQGLKPYDATLVAGYVHGFAGQLCAQNMNSRSVVARDVLAHISDALQKIETL